MRVGAARVAGMVAAAWGRWRGRAVARVVARAVEEQGGHSERTAGAMTVGKRVGRAMLHRGAQWVLWNAKKSVEGSE